MEQLIQLIEVLCTAVLIHPTLSVWLKSVKMKQEDRSILRPVYYENLLKVTLWLLAVRDSK